MNASTLLASILTFCISAAASADLVRDRSVPQVPIKRIGDLQTHDPSVAGVSAIVHEIPFEVMSGLPFSLTFPQHDPSLGTLLQVGVTMNVIAFGEGYHDNEAPFPTDCVEFYLQGNTIFGCDTLPQVFSFARFEAPGGIGILNPPVTYDGDLATCSVGPDDEPGPEDFMGPDSCLVFLSSGPATRSMFTANDLDPYIGTGTIEIDVTSTNWWCLEFCSNGSSGIFNSMIAGTILVEYLYDPTAPPSCPDCSDADANGITTIEDLVAMIEQWGCIAGCSADFNCDGIVDVQDLIEVLSDLRESSPCH